jgi:hypothetical protein
MSFLARLRSSRAAMKRLKMKLHIIPDGTQRTTVAPRLSKTERRKRGSAVEERFEN